MIRSSGRAWLARNTTHVLLALPMVMLGGKLGAQTVLNVATETELRTAISQANAGGGDYVINLGAGTFVLGGARLDNANFSGDLDITKPTGNLTLAGLSTASSIIDANLADRVLHVVGGTNVTLRDLTLRNGKATDNGYNNSEALGGCVLNEGAGTLSFSGVVLSGNSAVGVPGAAGTNGAAPGAFGGSGATGSLAKGGALYGPATLVRCKVAGNTARGGDGGNGGNGGPAGASVAGNGGNGGAGGMALGGCFYLAAGTLNIDQCSLEYNVAEAGNAGRGGDAHGGYSSGGAGGQGATGGEARGGAVLVASGQAELRDSTLFANAAKGGRGGDGGDGGNLQSSSAQYCSFGGPGGYGWHGGYAQGGGVYHGLGTLNLFQVTASGNQATAGDGGQGGHGGYSFYCPGGGGRGGNAGIARGAGLAIAGGNAAVANCTVAFGLNTRGNAGSGGAQGPGGSIPAQPGVDGSSPLSYGGGIYVGGGIVAVDSSIFSDNVSVLGVDAYGNMQAGSSLFLVSPQGTISPGSGLNIYGQDPQLQGLQPNGGPTWTHGLSPFGPAIDAGSNPYSFSNDQRGSGFARSHGAPDIGAFEYQPVSIPQAPVVNTPAAQVSVNAPSFMVTGSAQAGVEVRIYEDLNNNGNIDAQDTIVATQFLSSGTSFAIAVPLAQNAANNFLATAWGSAESQPADVPTILEDSTAPAAPVILSPAAPVGVAGANFSITGNAEADALVKVYADLNNDGLVNGGDGVVAQFQLSGAGKNFNVQAPLVSSSANDFLVTATDAAGNESAASDVPTITETSLPPTNAPAVTNPSGPISVNADNFTLRGTAPMDALVRVYLDLNHDGQIGASDTLVAQQQLPVGNTQFAIVVPLAQGEVNHFTVTAQLAGHAESAPTQVAEIAEDAGFSGSSGSDGGGCSSAQGKFAPTIAAAWLAFLALLMRLARRGACGTQLSNVNRSNSMRLLLFIMGAMLAPALACQSPSYNVSSGATAYSDLASYSAEALGDEDLSATIAPGGFAFTYFGASYTSFKIGSNGYLLLGSAGSVIDPMPRHTTEGLAISPFWTDLIPTKTTTPPEIAYLFAGSVLTVEWRNVEAYVAPGPGPTVVRGVRMQAILNCANGEIEFRYGTPSGMQPKTSNTTNSVAISAPGPGAHETINGFDSGYVDASGAVSTYPAGRYIRFVPAATSGLAIVTASPLPSGSEATTYSVQFAAQGGTLPYTWSASGLPAGWSISTSGQLSAPAASVAAGNFAFDVSVLDGIGKVDTRNFTVTINPPALQITSPATLPAGTAGQAYSFQFTAAGGVAPLFWSASTALPTGWSISAGGLLSAPGAAVATGSYNFTIEVSDSSFNPAFDSKSCSVDIVPATAPLAFATPSTLPQGLEGQSYSYAFNATGGMPPYSYNAGGLPTGWSMSPAGQLTSTSAAATPGSFSFNVQLSDSAGSVAANFSVTIAALPALTLTTMNLPAATLGKFYAASLDATGGSGSYSWTLVSGVLPPGIVGIPGAGTPSIGLTGTPTLAGDYTFVVQVSDSLGHTALRQFTLAVAATTYGGDDESGGCSTGNNAISVSVLLLALCCALAALKICRRPINSVKETR